MVIWLCLPFSHVLDSGGGEICPPPHLPPPHAHMYCLWCGSVSLKCTLYLSITIYFEVDQICLLHTFCKSYLSHKFADLMEAECKSCPTLSANLVHISKLQDCHDYWEESISKLQECHDCWEESIESISYTFLWFLSGVCVYDGEW